MVTRRIKKQIFGTIIFLLGIINYSNAQFGGGNINWIMNLNSTPIETCTGEELRLEVLASGDNVGYQWRLNGSSISGANQAVYVVPSIGLADAGSYQVAAVSLEGIIESQSVSVFVTSGTEIIDEPEDLIICDEGEAFFEVEAVGNNLTYQWFFEGVQIVGAMNPVFIINQADLSYSGDYSVFVEGDCGIDNSEPVILEVALKPDVNILIPDATFTDPLNPNIIVLGTDETILNLETNSVTNRVEWSSIGVSPNLTTIIEPLSFETTIEGLSNHPGDDITFIAEVSDPDNVCPISRDSIIINFDFTVGVIDQIISSKNQFLDLNGLEDYNELQVIIFDLAGTRIENSKIENTLGWRPTNLNTGLYIYKITSKEEKLLRTGRLQVNE